VLIPIRRKSKINTNGAPKWFASWVKNQYEVDHKENISRFDKIEVRLDKIDTRINNLVKVNNLKE
jgi:hypothetical protein